MTVGLGRSRRAARAAVVALPLATACCGTPPPASKFPTADDALGRMHQSYACVNGVQGVAKIDHRSPKTGRIRGELQLLAVNPDRVRFDVESFGVVLYTLASNGDRFQMNDVKQRQFLVGPAKPCNLARLTQVPVPGHALVSLLRGEAPVLKHGPTDATIEWDDGGFYKVVVASDNQSTEEIHLEVRPDDFERPWNQQRLRVTRVSVAQQGLALYEAELSRHEGAKSAPAREDPDGLDAPIPPSGGACDAELPR